MHLKHMAVDRAPEVRAIDAGRSSFGGDWIPRRLIRAPGRLELLGNHVDYNGGKVIAAAIDRTIMVAIESTDAAATQEIVFADVGEKIPSKIHLDELGDWHNRVSDPSPTDYLRGAYSALAMRGEVNIEKGARLAVAGDIPIGLGLSSSAALCVALVLSLSREALLPRDVVLLAQEAEHRAGTPCGTMDQSASIAGGFIMYDGSDVTFEKLEPDLGEHVFAVADSGVSRALAQSSYPIRVAESKEALAIANRELGWKYSTLAEITRSDLDLLAEKVPGELSETLYRRVRHVVTECDRVAHGYLALKSANWTQFGNLMTASGQSSANDYEISHPRVEELVTSALEVPDVLGARMMGGGEGGTALILARQSAIPALAQKLTQNYFAKYELATGLHVFQSAPGAGAVALKSSNDSRS